MVEPRYNSDAHSANERTRADSLDEPAPAYRGIAPKNRVSRDRLEFAHRFRDGTASCLLRLHQCSYSWRLITFELSGAVKRPLERRVGRQLAEDQRLEKFEYQFHSHVRPASAENARL